MSEQMKLMTEEKTADPALPAADIQVMRADTPLAALPVPHTRLIDPPPEVFRPVEVKLYHGTSYEEDKHGRHPKGCLINAETHTVICEPPDGAEKYSWEPFMVLAWKDSYTRWGDTFGLPPVYVDKPLAWVEANYADDLDWSDDGVPPKAVRQILMAVVFESQEEPLLLTVKGRACRSVGVPIAKHARRRRLRGQCPAAFTVSVGTREGKSGPYWSMLSVKVLDPSEDLRNLAAKYADLAEQVDMQPPADDDPVVEVSDDDIPF